MSKARRGGSAVAPFPEIQAGTWLEILPVLVDDAGLWYLRPRNHESWRVPCGERCAVRRHVRRVLASSGVRVAVIHSTSWRQERGAILLTHVAVVRAPPGGRPRDFERHPVQRRDLARGTATSLPGLIEVEDVVEHALRHLAWLSVEDLAIRTALDARWRETLRGYEPAPFCVFDRGWVSSQPGSPECGCGRDCQCGNDLLGGAEQCL